MVDALTLPPVPVVLVHGILGQEVFYWHFLRRRLTGDGFELREVTLPNLALGDLRAAAQAFAADVAMLAGNGGSRQFDVIAHSAGGLVVRRFLKDHAGPSPVRRLITLGTPHAGTRMVGLLPEVGMIGQVRPGSRFLNELNAGNPTPGPTCYTAIWTPFDGVVIPADSARLPLAENVENIMYPGITHWGYLFGPRMARVLAYELKRGFRGGERTVPRDEV